MRSDRVAGAGLLLAVTLAVAGCGGSSSTPKTLPPIRSAPATASVTPSATPTASRKERLAAATAVIRRYFALLNAATSVVNAEHLAALMTPECKCRRVALSTLRVARRGQRYYGGTHLLGLRANVDGRSAADVLVRYSNSVNGIATAGGRHLTSNPAKDDNVVDFWLAESNGQWRITSLVVVN